MPVVIETTYPTARKEHWCDCCGHKIDIGEKYLRQFNIFEGEPNTFKSHMLCNEIALAVFEAPQNEGHFECWPNILEFEQEDWQWLSENRPELHKQYAQRFGLGL